MIDFENDGAVWGKPVDELLIEIILIQCDQFLSTSHIAGWTEAKDRLVQKFWTYRAHLHPDQLDKMEPFWVLEGLKS